MLYKSSGEQSGRLSRSTLRGKGQKPGRRNVRILLIDDNFSNFVIFTGFETILNKVIAAYVVLSLPGWSTIFGDICL